jgi:hypothetical protein
MTSSSRRTSRSGCAKQEQPTPSRSRLGMAPSGRYRTATVDLLKKWTKALTPSRSRLGVPASGRYRTATMSVRACEKMDEGTDSLTVAARSAASRRYRTATMSVRACEKMDEDTDSLTVAARSAGVPALPNRERKRPVILILALERLHLSQHSRNQLRNSRMNMHRSLNHRVGRLGIHHIQNAVDRLVPAGPENRCA